MIAEPDFIETIEKYRMTKTPNFDDHDSLS